MVEFPETRGVSAAVGFGRSWPGVVCQPIDLTWETEPGSIVMRCLAPTLVIAVEEIGGRCQLRPADGPNPRGGYFGTDQVSLVAPDGRLRVQAQEMRWARLLLLSLDLNGIADTFPDFDASVLTTSRYMFYNATIADCAHLFGDEEATNNEAYGAAVARAILVALGSMHEQTPDDDLAALPDEQLDRVLAHILDNLDTEVTIRELAEMTDLAPAQFGPAFKVKTGVTVQYWQLDARVRWAQRVLLDDPHGTHSEAAKLTGFSDQSHFSRAFKQVIGVPPTAWLQRFR